MFGCGIMGLGFRREFLRAKSDWTVAGCWISFLLSTFDLEK
jgi:hypothetical protein